MSALVLAVQLAAAPAAAPAQHLTYTEAIVVGLVQGVTELFPVSSLGHNVLIPAMLGGQWAKDLNVSAKESEYLAYVVGLHVATAIGISAYFWRDWVRIIGGFFSSFASLWRRQRLQAHQKLAWMIVVATIPVGLSGLGFEHLFRVLFAVPSRAAVFLIANGVIMFLGERLRTGKSREADQQVLRDRERGRELAGPGRIGGAHSSGQRAARQKELTAAILADRRIASFSFWQALIIGSAQILALFAGISRDGVTMVTGMFRGLSREDAARFAFLLATPVILAAGVLKVGDLFSPLGQGILPQILAGSAVAGVAAYLSVRFLMKYFQTRTLYPFAFYCVIFGAGSLIYLSLK